MMNLTNQQLTHMVVGRNIIAMDRGYWSIDLIKYLTDCGFHLIGTHKRVPNYPFTFGQNRRVAALQRNIAENGAKSIYWAKKTINGNDLYALAYRDGGGRVATLFTTIRDLPMYTFEYVEKKRQTISYGWTQRIHQ
jgi:hypothetical protein